jgi:hypothetical protein
VRADISYLGCETIYATLDYKAPVPGEWVYDHSDGSLSVTLSAYGGAATESLTGHVSYQTWEVFRHTGTQATENRNVNSSTAEGATLTWDVTAGDAQASGPSASDATGGGIGYATLGTVASTVTLTASFSGFTASASTTVEVCTQDSDGDGFTDAVEGNAGSDPLNPQSVPSGSVPVTTKCSVHGGGYSGSIELWTLGVTGAEVEYTDSVGNERKQSISAQLAAASHLEIAESMSIDVSAIIKVTQTYGKISLWSTTFGGGEHCPAIYVPIPIPGNIVVPNSIKYSQDQTVTNRYHYCQDGYNTDEVSTIWTWEITWEEQKL